jgi:UPF0755 protein
MASAERTGAVLRAVTQALKVVSIVVIAGLIVVGGLRFFEYYRDKAAAEEHIGQKVVITIKKGDDEVAVAKTLHNAGLINSELYFKTLMKLKNGDIAPATYTFAKGTSVSNIVDLITTTKSTAKTEVKKLKLTIPEGWRATQIAAELDKIGYPPGGQAFLDAVKNYDGTQYDWLKDRPDKHSLEGYLFPDTYDITTDESPNQIIDAMMLNFDTKFTKDMRSQADADNLTIAQVMIIASIVEREAVVSSERPTIASVYLNRFHGGGPLGADPTIQYAVGNSSNWWPVLSSKDLEVDSPYNTYTRDGLPPTAIANPGMPSILAVLKPADTNYLYFVAKNDGSGEHVFAETAAEQDANKAQYGNGDAGSGGGDSGNSTQIQPVDGNSGG